MMTVKQCKTNKISSLYLILCCLFVNGTEELSQFTRFVPYRSQISVKSSDSIERFDHSTTTKCLVRCVHTDGCISISTNNATQRCELSTQNPYIDTPSPSQEPGWTVLHSVQSFQPIAAWQSSTHVYQGVALKAEFAIDGDTQNTNVFRCAHTLNSFSSWTVEMSGFHLVSAVKVYLWNNAQWAYRNRNLLLTVSSTRSDSDNNIGTLCATYGGPPSDISQPITVTCEEPVVGRFIKITHQFNNNLCLCEVIVF